MTPSYLVWGLALAVAIVVSAADGGYIRPLLQRKSLVPSLKKELDSLKPNFPQQVHISLSGENNMRISWITSAHNQSSVVYYGTSPRATTLSAVGNANRYNYLRRAYHSGEIHNAVIGPLKPNTIYYYRFGSPSSKVFSFKRKPSSKVFSFKTPPSQFPIKFAVVGDPGQTEWTKSTLEHVSKSNYDVLLLPGDLSYADFIQSKWDTFGHLVQPLASSRPWMVTEGNHEVEAIRYVKKFDAKKFKAYSFEKFKAYNARWVMPYKESLSPSNLFYSFQVSGVHVIMLGTYADFKPSSDQYRWLKADLQKVNRRKTPWIVVNVHAPWYNTNKAHQGETGSVGMKKSMEDLLYNARVDVVFAGHVHAYERFERVYKDQPNECGPIHITIGDGGNREGLATKYLNPKPKISAFREPSFGHGQLLVVNATHAFWTWHRNDMDVAVSSDKTWLTNIRQCS